MLNIMVDPETATVKDLAHIINNFRQDIVDYRQAIDVRLHGQEKMLETLINNQKSWLEIVGISPYIDEKDQRHKLRKNLITMRPGEIMIRAIGLFGSIVLVYQILWHTLPFIWHMLIQVNSYIVNK